MAISEARKKANKKWDQANMKSGSFKMYIDLFEEFEQFCKDNNISKNKVINEAVREYIENHEKWICIVLPRLYGVDIRSC